MNFTHFYKINKIRVGTNMYFSGMYVFKSWRDGAGVKIIALHTANLDLSPETEYIRNVARKHGGREVGKDKIVG